MLYSDEETFSLLDMYATWNRCFTAQEVAEWSGEITDHDSLRQVFHNDPRFISLNQAQLGPEYFLPEKTAFRWWANFNLRLATIQQTRLTERQLTSALNSLRLEGKWDSPPVDLLNYGRQFGFVVPAWSPGFCVFPIAYLLSQLTSVGLRQARETFTDFASPEIRNDALQRTTKEVIESWLSGFNGRVSHIVKCREGIPPYNKMTLAELGSIHGCTRERVRQIERNFWRKMVSPRVIRESPLVATLLAELLRRQGSLALDTGQENTALVCFLVKCLGLPYVQTKVGRLSLLGYSETDVTELSFHGSVAEATNASRVAERLDCGPLPGLGHNDLNHIASAIAKNRFSRITRQEKVYLALRHIGKPAHYSEVTETFNALFPDDQMSERNVHAVLSRCAEPNVEQYGIVWVRIKGTYALKEQGYERPSLGIFEAVAKIVEEKHAETGRPVHISVIGAELGRDRRLVDPASFAFATGANERLEQVSKGYFVPKDPDHETRPEIPANDLDTILREFRAARTD